MEVENSVINQLINFFLVLIPLGGGARVTLCAVTAIIDPDRKDEMKRRGKNALAYTVFAEIAAGLIGLVQNYYF